jgi:cell division protein FtsB
MISPKVLAYRGIVATLVILLLGLQFRLWVGDGSIAHVSSLGERVARARTANDVKDRRNEVLRVEIRDLKSSHEFIEEKARVEFGLIKEGETFFMLVEQNSDPKTPSPR